MTQTMNEYRAELVKYQELRDEILEVIKLAQQEHAHICNKFFARIFSHHHHGKKGKKRAEELVLKCNHERDVSGILKTLETHFKSGSGNDNPNSFKTILAKKLRAAYHSYPSVQSCSNRDLCRYLQIIIKADFDKWRLDPEHYILHTPTASLT